MSLNLKKRRAAVREASKRYKKVLTTLKQLWRLSDYLCGKRLSEYTEETLPILERFNEIKLGESTR